MNKITTSIVFTSLLITLATHALAQQTTGQIQSLPVKDNSLGTTTANQNSISSENDMEDCAVPMDENTVAPKRKLPAKKLKPNQKAIKPVELVDPNALTPPGESLAKVITNETKLTPVLKPKRPSGRTEYDHRNHIPDKFYQDKVSTQANSHLPKIVYQKDLSSLLFSAIEKQDIGAISTLLERGADINAMTIDTGFTPLMTAVWFNNEQATNYLIVKGADLDKRDGQGKSAMHIAVQNGNYNILTLLLRSGARWDIKDSTGEKPLDYAPPQLKNRMLLIAAEMSKDKNASLLEMVCTESIMAAKYLLEHGANIETRNKHGDTPLIIAAKHQNLAMVNFLLASGAQVNTYNMQNDTPLSIAKAKQNQEMVNVIETVAIKQELDSGISKRAKENSPVNFSNPVKSLETQVPAPNHDGAKINKEAVVESNLKQPLNTQKMISTDETNTAETTEDQPHEQNFFDMIKEKLFADKDKMEILAKEPVIDESKLSVIEDKNSNAEAVKKPSSTLAEKIKSKFFSNTEENVSDKSNTSEIIAPHEEGVINSSTPEEAAPTAKLEPTTPKSIIPEGLTE